MKKFWKVCAGVEEEGENQEVYVKTLANQTCSGELFLLDNDCDWFEYDLSFTKIDFTTISSWSWLIW